MPAATPQRDEEATQSLVRWARDVLAEAENDFEAGKRLAPWLGAHVCGDGVVLFGFWTPSLVDRHVAAHDVFIEILRPSSALDLRTSRQRIDFERTRLPVERVDNLMLVALRGLRAGSRETIGDFYALSWRDAENSWHRVLDPMAASLPFGAFAPAELYDMPAMQEKRGDRGYFEALACDGVTRMPVQTNILQLHVPTATLSGSLAGLAREIERIGGRIRRKLPLTSHDELLVGYDAIQLLPVEPTTVYEAGPAFWSEHDDDPEAATVRVDLRRPDTSNWGYDVVIAGSATVSPTLLESGRPDELVDLATALHNFPGRPIALILDVVFGHSDNQALAVLDEYYFAGANMYGQNLAYQNGMVRAILLDMQRRKIDFGADGVRIDGAQDFRWWDPDAQVLKHDDDFLRCMADVEQSVAGCRYRPWYIFEDGRPWPQEDWELSSTYRAVIEAVDDPDVFQWGPLTFAHNTPFLYGFWLSRWWRIREILSVGANWISGCANHDTLRRGTQVSTKLAINTRLGATRMEILDKAYDNPAIQMLNYAVFPGVPMDFLNASARASWGFIRNQDDRWGVKIMSEEAISLKWQVDETAYRRSANFRRLKAMGFEQREDLARFLELLPSLVEVTGYDLNAIVRMLRAVDPPLAGPEEITVEALKRIARAWMDDMHDYCNVARHYDQLSPSQTSFNLALREFRRARKWLRHNLGANDIFRYREPVASSVIFSALRHGPDGEQVLAVMNMEGAPVVELDPLELFDEVSNDGWHLALSTPPIGSDYQGGRIDLFDSMGVLFTRRPS